MPFQDDASVERNRWWHRRMQRSALTAGWVCAVIIGGYLYVAIDRQPNHKFVPVLVAVLVSLVAALCGAMAVRARRRRLGRLPDE